MCDTAAQMPPATKYGQWEERARKSGATTASAMPAAAAARLTISTPVPSPTPAGKGGEREKQGEECTDALRS